MELQQIRYVLSAAKHLNFTRASEECGVSQPALTKGVKALEADLGSDIFLREGRSVRLSAFGERMVPQLQQILDQADAARDMATSLRLLEKAPIRLGVMSTLGHARLAQFLSAFHRDHASAEIAVHEASLEDIADQLRSGALDAAIISRIPPYEEEFRTLHLYSERYVIAFPPGHRLASLNAVPLMDLSGENYVDRLSCEMREMVMGLCEEKEIDLYARFRSEREDWVQAMVHAGIGFAFMPEYSVTLPGLIQRPLIDPCFGRHVSLATVPGRRHTPALDAMIRKIRSFPWPQ